MATWGPFAATEVAHQRDNETDFGVNQWATRNIAGDVYQYDTSLRWANFDIPANATITAAVLNMEFHNNNQYDDPNLTIHAENVNGDFSPAPDYATVADVVVTRTPRRSAEFVVWQETDLGVLVPIVTPDFAPVLQAVVNGSGYVPNSSMALLLKGAVTGPTVQIRFWTDQRMPTLEVTYTEAPSSSHAKPLVGNVPLASKLQGLVT